jgi:hypothetical protein
VAAADHNDIMGNHEGHLPECSTWNNFLQPLYLPMQKRLKIAPSMASGSMVPVNLPSA